MTPAARITLDRTNAILRARTDHGYCCAVLSRGARDRGARITWFEVGW